MGKLVLLSRHTRYVDADGAAHWVEVTADVAAVLAEVEPALKERLLKDPGALEGFGATGYDWEGPRFSFDLLLGESPTWAGEASVRLADGSCRFCGHYRAMPEIAYCLGCDRSGKDRLVPTGRPRGEPAPSEATRREFVSGDATLKGGLG